ncbi:hypothetical protein [Pontibacter ruber]|uniref:Uncharacterized protein n=1 Tax=Pontibacter ruber TaxID=1343895 RepID=A0ABW5CVR3_9BACT|nr:hypothetical protein [Pontibacter ruber]
MIKFYSFLIGAFLLISVNANAQKTYPAILEFFNGDVKKGLIELPAPDTKKIKYQATPDDKQIKIEAEEVSAITLKSDSSVMRIENLAIEGARYRLLMSKFIEGKVSLYGYGHLGTMYGVITLYVKRASEEKATSYNGFGLKKRMSKYFEDDPETVKYIQETPLLKIDLEGVIHKYNARQHSKAVSGI